MKIGIITDCVDDGAAGVGVYTRNLVENLLKIDKKNEYVVVHYKQSRDSFYKGKKELIVEMKGLPFYRELRKAFLLPKVLEREGFDVVHEPMQIGPFFFKKKYKAVVTVHDLSPLLFPETFNRMIYLHHKYGMKRILDNVKAVVSDSVSTKNDLMRMFDLESGRVRVIPLGVTDNFRPASTAQKKRFLKKHKIDFPFLLYLGTIEPRKNLTALIKAFHKLRKKSKHKLVIGGAKGWKYSNIFQLIKELGLEEDIIFLGYIPDKDMASMYSSADVFVFPSIYEGFGLPPLEAMACGCPVITSDSSSLPEVVGDAAVTVKPDDTDGLAAAIEKVLASSGLKKSLIERGFKNVKRFSWKKCAEETLKVYKE